MGAARACGVSGHGHRDDRLGGLLVGCLLISSWSRTVLAGEAEASPSTDRSADSREQGRTSFDEGMLHAGQGRWQLALEAFRRSLAIHPSRASLRNIVYCLEKLNQFDEALEALETLAQRYPQFASDERAAFDAERAHLSQQVGFVEFVELTMGARVFIDGRDRGAGPLRGPVRVMAGVRRFRIVREEAPPLEGSFEVAAGEHRIVDVTRSNSSVQTTANTDLAPTAKGLAAAASVHSDSVAGHRVGLSVLAGGVFSSLGGGILECSPACERDWALGGRILARLAFRMTGSMRLFLDAGYMTMTQHVTARPTTLSATGFAPAAGKATDSLTLSGEVVGLSLEFGPPSLGPVLLRLGAGAWIGGVRDHREGGFQFNDATAGIQEPVRVTDQWQRPPVELAYLDVGVEIGHQFGQSWHLGIGLDFFAMIAIRQPAWQERTFATEAGQSWFRGEPLIGQYLFLASPSGSVRYNF